MCSADDRPEKKSNNGGGGGKRRDPTRECQSKDMKCFEHSNDHWRTAPLWDRTYCVLLVLLCLYMLVYMRHRLQLQYMYSCEAPCMFCVVCYTSALCSAWAHHASIAVRVRSGTILLLSELKQQHVLVRAHHQRDAQLPLLRVHHRLHQLL